MRRALTALAAVVACAVSAAFGALIVTLWVMRDVYSP